MEAVRYQNTLLTGRLEQAKAAKTKLTKEVSSLTKIIASIKLQNDDLLNQKNMMTDKDEKVKNEVKEEDEILHNETEDLDDSLGITEEERIFFEMMEEDNESEVFEMTEEEDKGEKSKRKKNKKEENLHANKEQDRKMQQLLYQNDLLLFWLEQVEKNEEVLQKEMNLLHNAKKNDTNQEVMLYSSACTSG